MCGEYDKTRFTQILINRQIKRRLDGVKEVIAASYPVDDSHHNHHTKSKKSKAKANHVSYNSAIETLLDHVTVTSGGHTLLLVK